MASNPEILKEAKQLKAAGKKLKPHHQAALDKAQRAVDAKRAKRAADNQTKEDVTDSVVSKGLADHPMTPRQESSRQSGVVAPVAGYEAVPGKNAINEDFRHHALMSTLADHVAERVNDLDSQPANRIGVGNVSAHLANVYDALSANHSHHRNGAVTEAQATMSKAASSLIDAEKAFKQHFPNETLGSPKKESASIGDLASNIAKNYVSSDTPGVGSAPDKNFTGTGISTKAKRISKKEKEKIDAAKEGAKPASLKRLDSLSDEQKAANKAAFESSNPKPAPTPANDRMVREATRAKISAIAAIKKRFPEAPNGAPEATFDHHVNKVIESVQNGTPISEETKKFLPPDVIFHTKRALQQAKVSGGIKVENLDSDLGHVDAGVTVEEPKIPSSDDAPGEVTLRPGRGGRSGSMAEFTNGRG
jgi:hypothetical protein